MKPLARLVAIGGALLLGWVLLRGGPKDVVLVYDLARTPGATALEVNLRRGAEAIRRAEFRFPRGAPGQVRHEVKLPKGAYVVTFRVDAPGGPVRGERTLAIASDETIVLPLGP
ncbi:MAG TPA: hypothetical protein VD838_20360 [Anaeromyxobacteraceae bacterium]|nr:hypothetical protein [Anaeromyxobacteraceae bacterium]